MKNKFEDFYLVILLIVITLVFECIFIITLFNKKINNYEIFNGIVIKDRLVEVLISDNDMTLFNSNSYIYYDNKRIEFEVEEVKRGIIKNYNSVLIKCNTKNKKVNDVFTFSIFEEKFAIIKIFKIIWKDDVFE